MKHTSVSLDARSEKAVSQLAERLGVSRSEIVRRCLVHAYELDTLPDDVSNPPEASQDGRSRREAIHKNGNPGRAPALGKLSDVGGLEDSGDGVEESTEESPAGDQRGNNDQDGTRDGLLDKKLW